MLSARTSRSARTCASYGSTCQPSSPSAHRPPTHLVALQHLRLLQRLHRVHLPRVHLLYQAHLAERALPNHLHRPEVVQADFRAAQAQVLALRLRVLADLALARLLAHRLRQARLELDAAGIALDRGVDRDLVVGLELELRGRRARDRIGGEGGRRAVEVHVVAVGGHGRRQPQAADIPTR